VEYRWKNRRSRAGNRLGNPADARRKVGFGGRKSRKEKGGVMWSHLGEKKTGAENGGKSFIIKSPETERTKTSRRCVGEGSGGKKNMLGDQKTCLVPGCEQNTVRSLSVGDKILGRLGGVCYSGFGIYTLELSGSAWTCCEKTFQRLCWGGHLQKKPWGF